MIDKLNNPNFESFLTSENASYLEKLQIEHADKKVRIDQSWIEYFKTFNSIDSNVKNKKSSPSWFRSDWPPAPQGDYISALDGQWNIQESEDLETKIREKASKSDVLRRGKEVLRLFVITLTNLNVSRALGLLRSEPLCMCRAS